MSFISRHIVVFSLVCGTLLGVFIGAKMLPSSAGTHHGVGEQHLQHYLNEYVFRFNRRRAPMAAFQSLLGLASQHQPTTYHMLYDGESTG